MKSDSHTRTQPADPAEAAPAALHAIQVAIDRRDNGGASAERDR